MKLPNMKYTSKLVKSNQIKFGGLAHYAGAKDGELWDMRNLTSAYYPLLASRRKRALYRTLAQPGGLFCREKLCWVDGTGFYYDGTRRGTVLSGQKFFASLGAYIVIMPDKCWYNVDDGSFGSIESTWTGQKLTFIKGADGAGSVLKSDGVVWADYFRVGDTVSVQGCSGVPDNNRSATIRGINGSEMTFGADTFAMLNTSANSYVESGDMRIARRMPQLERMLEHENRLWGYVGDTIYACKQGDIFNWYAYDLLADDAWSVDTGSPGGFTGCVDYAGYPVFFKEDRIFKVYGSMPSDFEVLGSSTLGLMEGSAGSLAVAGETLIYLNRSGIMAYTGGVPQPIGDAFGVERFHDAAAGSDGLKYYVSMRGTDGWGLYVYDTQKGLWHREDDLRVTHFARCEGGLYMLDEAGRIWIADCAELPQGASWEETVQWQAEFADFTEEEPNHKGFSKLQLRLELDEGASCQVWIQFDSDGLWRKVRQALGEGAKRSYVLPVVPRRADHYRLRITGTGDCRIYSLTREYYVGSEVKG